MTFDFDQVPNRRKSDSIKWQRYGNKDVVPMWIADMDFPSPPPIIEAIRQRVEHGIFGYAQPLASTIESVVAMLEERHQWKIDPSWIVWLPGLVSDTVTVPDDPIVQVNVWRSLALPSTVSVAVTLTE